MKLTLPLLVLALAGAAVLSACRTYPNYANDFRFPIQKGDVDRGKTAFVSLGCPQCHVVDGVQLPEYKGTRFISMPLGGELVFVKTYADIVTSIINPNHVISEKYLSMLPANQRSHTNTSPMYMNPEMKVTELIDIVAFLNSRYRLLPGYTDYYY